ncbi:acetyltransferase [Serratia sp. DD3]|uniref:lipase family alpha/beta hydrolase n=1 Tax=Serratia sp. DD3 TaxID=1410619 RepID=UPI0004D4CD4D|nr:acetyltransferase [Serratia sp. DD3]KEY58900.1 PGAP1-like protein [Serratia sp. DD3]
MNDEIKNPSVTDNDQCVSYHLPEWRDNGKVGWHEMVTQTTQKNAIAKLIMPPTKVIPVIFIPGVMGTNLMSTDDTSKVPVWRGDSPVDTYFAWANRNGKERRELLDPDTTKVDGRGEISQNVYSKISDDGKLFPTREKRHWGEVLFFSYGQFLSVFQGVLMDDWQKIVCQAADRTKGSKGILSYLAGETLGADKESVMTAEELNHFSKFLFPVHAFGYNWLQDNKKSAKELATYIDDVISIYTKGYGHGLAFPAGQEKVIIVTHSMGGLVARYASQIFGCQDKILGIVHGVIPDLGSPAAYRRMKIGARQEGAAGKVLGATAKELMPVLAQAPAALQLLPSPKYMNGDPWLTIKGGDEGKDLKLPKTGDPFSEIYLSMNELYRLYEPDIIDGDNSAIKANWINFNILMKDSVRKFIYELDEAKYHPNTYVFYGEEIKSDGTLAWNKTQSPINSKELPNTHKEIKSPYNRTQKYELVSSKTPGDGTVPVESLAVIKKQSAIKSILATNVDHQDAYAVKDMNYDNFTPAIKFTLRSIVKMVQEVPTPC